MIRPICKCMILGFLGAILFISVATFQGNPIMSWGVPTWSAFMIMLGGFTVCGIIQRKPSEKKA